MLIYFPNGSSIWYGRATPADVAAIVRLSHVFARFPPRIALTHEKPPKQVDRTVMQGKVIPELLRGGLGLAGKTGPRGVLDW